LGAYFSVAFSEMHADDAGAVGVAVGVAFGEADSLAGEAPKDAAD
jgi:hypothetical protein